MSNANYKKRYRAANIEILRERDRIYREANKEKIKAARAEYVKNHKDIIDRSIEAWRKAHPEKVKSAKKFYRLTHPEKVKAQKDKWRVSHPEVVRGQVQRRRARKAGVSVERFLVSEIYERDRWICQLCKKKVNKRLKYPNKLSASLDHIVPLFEGGQHTRNNVQLAHWICNINTGVGGVKQLRLM